MQPTPVIKEPTGPGCLVGALWFLLIGWWLSGLAIGLAYLAAVTIVGLPLAFWIFNRIPAIATLRGRTQTYVKEQVGAETLLRARTIEQRPLWLRAIYFVLIGWWFGAVWLTIAWILSITFVGLPIAYFMYNRTGAVMTLLRY